MPKKWQVRQKSEVVTYQKYVTKCYTFRSSDELDISSSNVRTAMSLLPCILRQQCGTISHPLLKCQLQLWTYRNPWDILVNLTSSPTDIETISAVYKLGFHYTTFLKDTIMPYLCTSCSESLWLTISWTNSSWKRHTHYGKQHTVQKTEPKTMVNLVKPKRKLQFFCKTEL